MSDLAIFTDPAEALDRVEDPGQFVVLACERARTWLKHALAEGDMGALLAAKQFAEVLRVATAQREIGKDAELTATEIVRRAERAIGLAIRQGQEKGEIATRTSPRPYKNQHGLAQQPHESLPSPSEVAGLHQQERTDIYAMTDNVTDADFETAITAAKAEGNLARANVIRKVKNDDTRGKDMSRNPLLVGRRRIDPNRVIAQIVIDADPGPKDFWELVDYSALDRDQLQGWVNSLAASIRSLTAIKTALAKELTRD